MTTTDDATTVVHAATFTSDQARLVRSLRAASLPLREIERRTGIGYETIRRWCHTNDAPKTRQQTAEVQQGREPVHGMGRDSATYVLRMEQFLALAPGQEHVYHRQTPGHAAVERDIAAFAAAFDLQRQGYLHTHVRRLKEQGDTLVHIVVRTSLATSASLAA